MLWSALVWHILTRVLAAVPIMAFVAIGAHLLICPFVCRIDMPRDVALLQLSGAFVPLRLIAQAASQLAHVQHVRRTSIHAHGGGNPAGFDHVIANMFLVPFGMKLGSGVSVGTYIWRSMIPVYIGNTLSGARPSPPLRAACRRHLAAALSWEYRP